MANIPDILSKIPQYFNNGTSKERMMAQLGTGFRKSHFYVEIDFDPSKTKINHIIYKSFLEKSIDKLKLALFFKYGSPTTGFYGIVTRFQIPNHNVETLINTFPTQTRIVKGVPNRTLTLDFINDQDNIQWTFWNWYIKNITENKIVFLENYYCDIKVYILDMFKVQTQKITFKNCVLKNIPDLDLDYNDNTLTEIKLDFDYSTYSVTRENNAYVAIRNGAIGIMSTLSTFGVNIPLPTQAYVKSLLNGIISKPESTIPENIVNQYDEIFRNSLENNHLVPGTNLTDNQKQEIINKLKIYFDSIKKAQNNNVELNDNASIVLLNKLINI